MSSLATLQRIFSGMEKGPEAIDSNFNSLTSDLNSKLGNINRKNSQQQTSSITGYQKGFIAWSRVGNMVIVSFDVQLGQIKVNWNIVTCPTGYRPSVSCKSFHFMLGDKELTFNDTGTDLKSQSDVLSGGWFVGQCVYFTDDDFPA